MTKLSKANFETKYNDASTGLYKTGQSEGIGSDDHRTQVTDTKDSLVWLDDHVGYDTGFPEVLTEASNAIAWDLDNKLWGDAKVLLNSGAGTYTLTISNAVLGTRRSLWVNASLYPIQIDLAGGTFYGTDRRSPITYVRLYGSGTLWWKITFEFGSDVSPELHTRVTVEGIDKEKLHVNIQKTTHGLAVGDIVVYTGSAYVKLSALSQVPLGIVDFTDGANQFRIVSHGVVNGLSGLTANTMYYVQSSGVLGTTPTNLPFLYAISTTAGYIVRQAPQTSGIYTPTLTGVSNVDGTTAYACRWIRDGNIVSVSGRIDVDPTAAASTQLRISLPIASNLANNHEATGHVTGSVEFGTISADTANDELQVDFIASITSSHLLMFTAMYQIN